MKKLVNHTPGPRGINLVGGSTHWVEPGAEVSVASEKDKHFVHVGDDKFEVAGALPDFGKKGDEPTAEDAALVEAVQAENADLKAQVADLTAKLAEATKK